MLSQNIKADMIFMLKGLIHLNTFFTWGLCTKRRSTCSTYINQWYDWGKREQIYWLMLYMHLFRETLIYGSDLNVFRYWNLSQYIKYFRYSNDTSHHGNSPRTWYSLIANSNGQKPVFFESTEYIHCRVWAEVVTCLEPIATVLIWSEYGDFFTSPINCVSCEWVRLQKYIYI